MFTAKEKKNLAKLLARAADPDDALNLEELHGFLFGLAIIPELIKPSEWLPVVFGEEMIEVESEAEVGEQLGHLFSAYNRLNTENQAGALAFPFALDAIRTGDLLRIGDWTYGLYLAITLRPGVWGFDSQTDWNEMTITDDIQEISTSVGIIMSIAKPELIPEIFKRKAFDPEASESDLQLQATLFALLPAAVATVQEHAGKLNKERSAITGLPAAPRRGGIGRNDPCPCGSGKKYKRCCGMN